MGQTHLSDYDAIVVGGGVMGLSAAAELGSRGQSVLVVDQFSVPNARGSSHGETRVIRTAYFEHVNYVPLAVRAWSQWEALEAQSDATLVVKTGGLYLGEPTSPLIAGSVRAARDHELTHRVGDEVDSRWFNGRVVTPQGCVPFWEADCGVLFAARCLAALVRKSESVGVEIRTDAKVTGWTADRQSAVCRFATGYITADRLIICAGPWSSRLLVELGLPTTVTRQVIGYTRPTDAHAYELEEFPVVCFELPDGDFYYTIPCCKTGGARSGLFKVGHHTAVQAVDPDAVDRSASPKDASRLLAGLTQVLPAAGHRIEAIDVCLYTNTPDGHFVVDRHPSHANVVFAAGFSGHGFKFAPVIGEALADLTIDGATSLPISFLGLDRFRS